MGVHGEGAEAEPPNRDVRLPRSLDRRGCVGAPSSSGPMNDFRDATPSKVPWSGVVTAIQPRIRLTRSYDEITHSYLGFMLRLRGRLDGEDAEFSVGLGSISFRKHALQVGARVSGLGVHSSPQEPADLYRISKLEVEPGGATHPSEGPPWIGEIPDLQDYRWRGHRRLDPKTFRTRCITCRWACRMAVEIILDKWDPSLRKYRYETFCYGPNACPFYRAGRTRRVPWKGGPSVEIPDWVDREATEHRGPDD